jgi:hypothetical protein
MTSGVDEIKKMIDSVPIWHHRIELSPGIFTPAVQWTNEVLA